MNKVNNRAMQRTRGNIKLAFADLISEKRGINKITVCELSEKANISRGTFYNHYNNISAVAADFETDILNLLPKGSVEISGTADIDNFFDLIFAYIQTNESVYRQLLSATSPMASFQRLTKAIGDRIYSSLKEFYPNENETRLKFYASFFTDGIISQIVKYFNGELSCTLDEIAEYTKNLFYATFDIDAEKLSKRQK